LKQWQEALRSGRRLTIGIDYYARTGLCSPLLPPEIARLSYGGGEVYRGLVWLEGNQIMWRMNND